MRVLVIDSHNMIHRARFGFGDGAHKIYFNFFRMLMGEMKTHQPDIVYIVDEGSPVQSLAVMKEYKANRQRLDDPQFHREKAEIFDTVQNLSGLVYIRHPEFECDDVIGHIATELHPKDDVVIVSTDSDFIQLISDRVRLWHPKKKKFLDPWHVDYITWKSLKGDPTDNVPGVVGVGPKRADVLCKSEDLLKEFLGSDPERRRQFETARTVIQLKNVTSKGLQISQADLCVDGLYKEFSHRSFRSIIGKAWPKWCAQFEKSGEKTWKLNKCSTTTSSNFCESVDSSLSTSTHTLPVI